MFWFAETSTRNKQPIILYVVRALYSECNKLGFRNWVDEQVDISIADACKIIAKI